MESRGPRVVERIKSRLTILKMEVPSRPQSLMRPYEVYNMNTRGESSKQREKFVGQQIIRVIKS